MQNELEGLYNMLVSQTDIMKNVDELVEKQIEHELMQFKELATWSDYECERDKYMAVAEVAKKESFMAGFNYAVRLLERTHNPYDPFLFFSRKRLDFFHDFPVD